ncbi:hypothetical protein [Geoglobus acetivorans]|uniref:Uncharacterized protein n=1 Tax=Geoglobus acetivorans TaxID=565033 RepID=A0ABZ3H3Z8_GEOAI|nr:hypothetical protein [Geoglobus acetivorans]
MGESETACLSSRENGNTIGEFGELRFTGNWFIDAGILGFVNLMEEVYGWDLEELQRRIREEPEVVYYGYFPFAYLFYHSKVRSVYREITNTRKTIQDLKKKRSNRLEELSKLSKKEKGLSKKEIKKIEKLESEIELIDKNLAKLERHILDNLRKLEAEKTKLKSDLFELFKKNPDFFDQPDKFKPSIEKLIEGFDLNLPADHRNFFLYNPKKDLHTSYVYLKLLLQERFDELYHFVAKLSSKKKKEGLSYEIYPDSTINPFLYSPGEFPNLGYTMPSSIKDIKHGLKLRIPVYLLLLSFSNAFTTISGRYIMFYVNEIWMAYAINKRIKKYIEKLGENISIFKVTWMSIIDELVECKAQFSLENMYLIEFGGIDNQKLTDVEFIGIPKLQAYLLLDDYIRESFNVYLSVNDGDKQVWVLEEFIKGRPLYPLILRHVEHCLTNNLRVNYRTSVYALCIDAKIREHQSTSELFGESFLTNYRQILWDVKDAYRSIGGYVQTVRQILGKDDCLQLIAAIRKGNKVSFVNYVLKKFLEKSHRNVGFIFRNIVNNDISWENYALSLVVGVLGGVSENDSGENYEE